MRIKTRVSAVLAAAVLVAGPLGACGNDETDPVATDPVTTDTVTTDTVTTDTVTVYFSRDGDECDEVEAVVREVTGPVTPAMMLGELLAGPTDDERDAGFGSWFSSDTAGMLRSVEIDDGLALVSFASELPQVIPGASSSCGSANLLAQLDATLTELPEIDRAVYSLDGDVDAFYEWLQMESPEH